MHLPTFFVQKASLDKRGILAGTNTHAYEYLSYDDIRITNVEEDKINNIILHNLLPMSQGLNNCGNLIQMSISCDFLCN